MKHLVLLACVLTGGGFTPAARAQSADSTPAAAASSTPAAAPSPTPLSAVTAPATLQRTELYFGGIATVSWNDFLADTVTPRFPDGFTWFDTHGQWQTSKGEITRQDSRVLVILHAPTAEKDKLVEEVRELFKARFHEMSVLRSDATVTASF